MNVNHNTSNPGFDKMDSEGIYDKTSSVGKSESVEMSDSIFQKGNETKPSQSEELQKKKSISKRLFVILIILVVVGGTIFAAQQKAIEKKEAALAAQQKLVVDNKKEEIRAVVGNVLGTWYECDIERTEVRKLTLSVDPEGTCVFTVGSEAGVFDYTDGQIELDYDTREGVTALKYEEDDDGNTCLYVDDTNTSFYRNKEIIESQKFAAVLRTELPGKWKESFFGYVMRIKADGTYEFVVSDVVSSGNWTITVLENKVKFEFVDLKKWNNVYNEFREIEDNAIEWGINDYELCKEELRLKDYALCIDYDYFYLDY